MSTDWTATAAVQPESGVTRSVPFRGSGFVPSTNPWIGLATLVAVLLLWQVVARLQSDRVVLPAPAEIWAALAAMARSGELALHAGASLRRRKFGFGNVTPHHCDWSVSSAPCERSRH